MLNLRPSCAFIQRICAQQVRGMKKYQFPVTYENVRFPPNGQRKLPVMPSEPFYDAEKGEKKYKSTKRMIEARGVEEIHTELIHEQYGLAAVSGGFISSDDFKFLQDRINKNLIDNQFAIWRVDPPWLPRTKKAQGTRLGGGKGSIQKYVTPVRANRIILEVGGYITEIEAKAFLLYLCERFSFPVEFVSEKMLAERRNSPMALGEDDILSIPFKYFVFCIGGLPASALLICVFLALTLHFEQSTSTHCMVDNWLPSISAAVSTYAPEKYIWRILIGLHIGPRFAVSAAFRNYLLSSPLRPLTGSYRFRHLCNFACFLNIFENFFLLALTSISSSEDHGMHAKCFGGFAICSILYMVLSTILFDQSGRRRATNLGERSYEYKILGAAVFIFCFVMGAYLYWRHNTYCEPGIYTLFALVEYSAVLSNIFFHCTLYFDFHGKSIALTSLSFGGGHYSILPTQIEKDT
ncbi:unnamed protein product [Caenorhabditis bovis]|uniref:CWH43-like N-terminal domain-containing protein n=1 Tax=Caenorhabditis bovis TaxID=2654633 RepID=A0A8S1EJU7_9PELO|nr:unnamed protein product [Caenorhabditis bovis]